MSWKEEQKLKEANNVSNNMVKESNQIIHEQQAETKNNRKTNSIYFLFIYKIYFHASRVGIYHGNGKSHIHYALSCIL
jgi:hypothetical protein